jgi:hypothetical protein
VAYLHVQSGKVPRVIACHAERELFDDCAHCGCCLGVIMSFLFLGEAGELSKQLFAES